MLYVISVTGYEDYDPHWFSCNLSKEDFEAEASASVDKAIESLCDSGDYIDGYRILEKAIPILCGKKNISEVKPDHEFNIGGGCIYRRKEKPEIFSEAAWDKIISHNNKINDAMRNITIQHPV